jgi:hypothetical protein
MSNSNNYPQSFQVAKLYRRKSEKGNTYFAGRWGGARVTLFKSKEVADDGGEIWSLMLAEAPPKRDQDAGQRQEPSQAERRQPAAAPQRDWQRPAPDDDAIPF